MVIEINQVRQSGELISGSFISGTDPDQRTLSKAEIRSLIGSGELVQFRKGSGPENDLLNENEIKALITDSSYPSYFNYRKTIDFIVPDTSYSQVDRLTTIDRPPGTYIFMVSWTCTLDSTTSSQYFRYSLDDGVSWEEYVIEPKDSSDKTPFAYMFPFEHPGGPLDVIFQARKEKGGDQMIIQYLDLMFDRKA